MAKKIQLYIEQKARVDILHAEGLWQQAIAKELGISEFGVHYVSIERQKHE
jgi:predicted transcriptional regulator